MQAEHNRQIANLIKQGNIAQVNPSECRVRVALGELTSDWLPYFVPCAGGVSVHRPPSVGENCIVISPSGETANGLVLCGLMSTAFPSPAQSADETVIIFPDGARFEYNHAASSLHISGIQTATVQASQAITFDTPQATFTGKLTVENLLTYLSGMAGSNGTGGSTTISGDLQHIGGALSSNGVVLHSHTHTGDSGGTTGAPQ
ncbi:phage baseplate assembly protein V [Kingella kingae]|uniref:phage baseplate assembly protein V n=1 Tax=Kingella kingae TaxID=504 RepID=UPI002556E058|nr:phage baseplate assembly protein V [Kingella kingae]MDK4624577.1 phage baseplate assembly protein V [Kingella kingae]MDK4660188.1 phage baseplate assembly protein V [Kingella kingae]MDK4668174.1 phage baseplate assembly protein V [Kingella kingae]MDK4686401.1 phage baseplate assembly protein V [Kingella kingae]